MRKGVPVASTLLVLYVTALISPRGRASVRTSIPKIIQISAKNYEFSPVEIRVRKGERVELQVHSVDETHGIKIDIYPEGSTDKEAPGLVFDHPEQNGKAEKNIDQYLGFVAAEPGTYEFKCAKLCGYGHGRMQGKLIVEA